MIEFIESLHKRNVSVSLNGEDLDIHYNGNLDETIISEIRAQKEPLISFLRKHSQVYLSKKINAIQAHQTHYDISNAQKRLWILSQDRDNSIAYNLYNTAILNGAFDKDLFEEAILLVVKRHEILRTTFVKMQNAEIKQIVSEDPRQGYSMDFIDLSNENNYEKVIAEFVKKDSKIPFDLSQGPLLKTVLFKTGHNRNVFYYNIHHIISDGWSMEIMLKELMFYYESLVEGNEVTIAPLKIQYKDYAAWQLSRSEDPAFEKYRSYWKERLQGVTEVLDLPTIKMRPPIMTYKGHGYEASLSKESVSEMRNICKTEGASIFMGLLAVWNILFHKYLNTHTITLGTVVAGRYHPDLEDQIGFYVNTLPLRNTVDPEDSFVAFLHKIKNNTLQDFSHQEYPFDHLVEDLSIERDRSRNAIFDVMLVLQNELDKVQSKATGNGKVEEIRDIGPTSTMFDMTLDFQETSENITFQVFFNTDIYEKNTILRLIKHFRSLFEAAVASPKTKIRDVQFISNSEKEIILEKFNDTSTTYPKNESVIQIFEKQVLKTPENSAITYNDVTLSYSELNALSNRFAEFLKSEYALTPTTAVGIELQRSHWFIICILGILKSGGTYVPIDPEYPQEHKSIIVEQSECKIVVNQDIINSFQNDCEKYAKENSTAVGAPNDSAYIMFTSGSTGKPKGVLVSHKSVVRLVKSTNYVQINNQSNILGLSNFCFDGSVFDIFMPLLNGARLVISTKDVFLDLKRLETLLRTEKISCFFTTTAFFNVLVDAKFKFSKSLESILFGGELVSVQHVSRLQQEAPALQLIHVYGPTENTTFSTFRALSSSVSNHKTIPIGLPISNTTAYILDDNQEILPIGVLGEICLGGNGLAKGYLGQNNVTKLNFVASPFNTKERLYRTGDLGYWTENNGIVFVGRSDNQVKIRGHRIELGEIKYRVLNHEFIQEVYITTKPNIEGRLEIIVYYKATQPIESNELKSYLARVLPSYMLPNYFIPVPTFSLNRNGKIDQSTLPLPIDVQQIANVPYKQATNEIETFLVVLWQEVLHKGQVGIKDDYFELGGHSLNALKIISRINDHFDIHISIKNMFEYTTIETLGAYVNYMVKQKFLNESKETMTEIDI